MVTFETKVWEKDWKYILMGDYLEKMISLCNYNFEQKNLIINNVKDRILVTKYAEIKKRNGVIDNYYFAEDYAEEVLAHFNIDKDKFDGGYYYSIAELVSIYLCNTKYLLHFSSDSYLVDCKNDWIAESIKIFNERSDVIVANPIWNYEFENACNESFGEIDNFFLGFGFSDQCFLIKTDVFKKDIYNERNLDSERYPKYGGELFEKRVDSFMRNNNLYRITNKHQIYIHKNFVMDYR